MFELLELLQINYGTNITNISFAYIAIKMSFFPIYVTMVLGI